MAVVALSLLEEIIPCKVLKPKLSAVNFGVNAVGIMMIGCLFNRILHQASGRATVHRMRSRRSCRIHIVGPI